VLWGLFNLLIGYFLFKGGKIKESLWGKLLFFIGITAKSVMLSIVFMEKAYG